MFKAAISWIGFAGLYILFAGSFGLVEAIASLICATVGLTFVVGLSRIASRRFGGKLPAKAILGPLRGLIPEAVTVGCQFVAAIFVFKNQRGAFVWQSFDPGGDDPVSTSRRAAVVLGISLAPGSFVVRGDRMEKMILHTLPEKASSADHVWPA